MAKKTKMQPIKAVAEELNEVLGIAPPINIKAPVTTIEKKIREAGALIEADDEFTEDTTAFLQTMGVIEGGDDAEEEEEEKPKAKAKGKVKAKPKKEEPAEEEEEEDDDDEAPEEEEEEKPKAKAKATTKKDNPEKKESMEALAIRLRKDGSSDKAIAKVFTAAYKAKGKTDAEYIKKRIAIYLKIADAQVK